MRKDINDVETDNVKSTSAEHGSRQEARWRTRNSAHNEMMTKRLAQQEASRSIMPRMTAMSINYGEIEYIFRILHRTENSC